MKNKKNLYILLPITLFVWVAIIYKVFISMGDKEETFNNKPKLELSTEDNIFKEDTIKLKLSYPDPFLKAPFISKNSQSEKKTDIKSKLTENEFIQWPTIQYYGLVKNSKTKQQKINLSINGKMYIMKRRELKDNIRLLQIYNDSIECVYNNEKKTIKKL
jgi:hypothetical protein